jgi:hypothetical protein
VCCLFDHLIDSRGCWEHARSRQDRSFEKSLGDVSAVVNSFSESPFIFRRHRNLDKLLASLLYPHLVPLNQAAKPRTPLSVARRKAGEKEAAAHFHPATVTVSTHTNFGAYEYLRLWHDWSEGCKRTFRRHGEFERLVYWRDPCHGLTSGLPLASRYHAEKAAPSSHGGSSSR